MSERDAFGVFAKKQAFTLQLFGPPDVKIPLKSLV